MAQTKDPNDTLIMDAASDASITKSDDAAPKRIAHYNLKREIGRGARSVVYEAQDMRTGQDVAVKLLSLSPAVTPEDAERLIEGFEREARIAARLSHPNIVHVHEVSPQQNRHFLAMEYLNGQTLRKRMSDGALTPQEAAPILSQIAGALDAVHKAEIVHRDVKPANVMLLPDGTAKLLDFGNARSGKDAALTPKGMSAGSPFYMAPEQIKGETGTAATDIWALGVLSYEMLTGHLPFDGLNVGGVMFQIMHEPPAPMPDLPPAVQKVLLRALDKRPSQRYPTAGAFVQALKLAYPRQAPVTPEQKPAALPKRAASPKPARSLKPAASFSLPGPKWVPEAALLGLFLLGFSGAYLVRLHTDSHTQKAANLTAARNLRQPAPVSVQASAPPDVLPASQPQASSSDVPAEPSTAPAEPSTAPAVSVPLKAQAETHDKVQAVPRDDQAASQVEPVQAQALAVVPVQPRRPASNPATKEKQASQHLAAPTARQRLTAPILGHPAPLQVASQHVQLRTAGQRVPIQAASQQVPVQRADRSEPVQNMNRSEPVQNVNPPVSAQGTGRRVPAQSNEQAYTLPAGGDGYDPEADARRRKADWSENGSASHP